MNTVTPAALIRVVLLIIAVVVTSSLISSTGIRQESGPPTHGIFTEETGIKVGPKWKLLDSGDDHGGMMGDGETFFVFQVPEADIQAVLDSSPPWSDSWRSGPVDHQIGFHCNFGTSGVSFHSSAEGDEYRGDPGLTEILSSEQNAYDAKDRCCDSLPWHNGHLIVVDSENNQIWLSIWDY